MRRTGRPLFLPVWFPFLMLVLALLPASAPIVTPVPAGAAPAGSLPIPADFFLVAGAGGVSADHEAHVVALDSTGLGDFCVIEPADRDIGQCTTVTTFSIDATDVETIWQALNDHNFFLLSPYYESATIADGTFAKLMVIANGDTQAVMTQNMAVPDFDSIMLTINSVLPVAYRLNYNEINP